MKEIIEDTISRNKAFQANRQMRVNRLKELKAPADLIQHEEMISKMTLVEYEIYCNDLDKEDKRIMAEYANNNPIQKHIVDEIYNRESKLNYDYFTYSSTAHFIMAIDPLSFMSSDDYENDLYKTFLQHANELYRGRHRSNHKIEE